MKRQDFTFIYPEDLIAIDRAHEPRVMLVDRGVPYDLRRVDELLEHFQPGDLLVLNNTQVLRRRVFALNSKLEILFIKRQDPLTWEVLCPVRRWTSESSEKLPGDVDVTLVDRGIPQLIRTSRALDEDYFSQFGELPLPPYIQKARDERHSRDKDLVEYQTAWAKIPGSLAAPTASFHLSHEHLKKLINKGVQIAELTLHVGLGTFLPIRADDLNEHQMHKEWLDVPSATWTKIEKCMEQKQQSGSGRVWAWGTTVARALESCAQGRLVKNSQGGFSGFTDLFIKPGFQFQVVDVLATNFHQPESTLLALVAAFAGLKSVKANYAWAIERHFRLFSYGDLTVWMNPDPLSGVF